MEALHFQNIHKNYVLISRVLLLSNHFYKTAESSGLPSTKVTRIQDLLYMAEAGARMSSVGEEQEKKRKMMLMWGYLPGTTPEKTPLLSPTPVKLTESFGADDWNASCGGGCGFAMAITEAGKLVTWGSTEELGQSYLTSGKHEEIPEAFPLPGNTCVVKAAAGWAHCMVVTDEGELYTWGWEECVPSQKASRNQMSGGALEMDGLVAQGGSSIEQGSQLINGCGVLTSFGDNGSEECTKRRRVSLNKQDKESKPSHGPATSNVDNLAAQPFLVNIAVGVKITAAASGGRHALALSDTGEVWGWGYGGEGQLGLGDRVRMVPSPHLIRCLHSDKGLQGSAKGISNANEGFPINVGSRIKAIACGGRHSAVITDTGTLLTFGWSLHGQCGQGRTVDELRPTCVSSLMGIEILEVSAGLWHTVCISAKGDVYAFGGNQFGQLGAGSDQYETLPKLLDSPCLGGKHSKMVSCGARHTALLTDDGKVFSWGWNKYGQLGLGDTADRSRPAEVPMDGFLPKDVSCGWWHTLVLCDIST